MPAFSPDGRFIVFTAERGSVSSLARVQVDGSGFQFLTSGTLSYGAPSFFPDGLSVLAPAGSSEGQLSQLVRVGVSGGSPVFVANNLGNEALSVVTRAALSLDGAQVVFDGRLSSGGARLFRATLGSQGLGTPVRLTEHPGEPGVRDTFPCWHSASELGFLSSAGGTDSIYRIGASASGGSGSFAVPGAAEPSCGGT